VSAAAFVGLGTAMALAGPGASSTAPPRSNRAAVDPFTTQQGTNNWYGDGVGSISDDSRSWSAQPPSASATQGSSSSGNFASGGANTSTHGS
jgi:hypothetical protein